MRWRRAASFTFMLPFLSTFGLANPDHLEQQMLYRPYAHLDAFPNQVGLAYETIWLQTADGVRLHGWYIPAAHAEAATRTLLYCHGNGGNISHRLERAVLYHRLGFHVLFFDYRGFGESAGVPSEQGTYADARAAWNFLTKEKQTLPQQIVLYGESLGCAVALETALRVPARALILESPFTSTVAIARRLFPNLPVDAIVKNRYDNLSKIRNLKMPLLILHSPSDGTVPFSMGEALFAVAPAPKQFVRLRGSHAFGYHDSGPLYTQALEQFLR